MTVLYVLAAVVVIIVIALLAVGRLGELPPPSHDRPPLDLPPADIEPADVDAVRFAVGVRGYRMDEVDVVLDRVSEDLAARDRRIDQLERALTDSGLAVPPAPVATAPDLSDEPVNEEAAQ